MAKLPLLSLKATHYKSFGAEPTGFEEIRPLNLIVGRNNSGKSALVDLVAIACKHDGIPQDKHHNGVKSKLYMSVHLGKNELQRQFSPNSSGTSFGGNFWDYGQRFLNRTAIFAYNAENTFELQSLDGEASDDALALLKKVTNPSADFLQGKSFHRLLADRDIVRESDNGSWSIQPNGNGFTNVVQRLLNKATLPSKLIDIDMLAGLNEIFGADASFTDIVSKQHEEGNWEIFLRQDHKGLISLSNSGSGLKTVLLVLGFFICLPFMETRTLDRFVFAFEELENNLHPALQRRLIQFIRKKCADTGCVVFLTTHSSAVIDLVSHDEETQILHVSHSGKFSEVRQVTTYVHNRGVLDDLDVRASDLLQANGIVWVEGPSDRLYFNKWINLISDGALQEGTHYQCVFYGGRLLAHLSGAAPFDAVAVDEAVKIFAVNRNAAVLIDSDKRSPEDDINSTKNRIVDSVAQLGGIVWVTQGKEIENYLSPRIITQIFPGLTSLAQFDELPSALEKLDPDSGKKFLRAKVVSAEMAAEITTRGDLAVLDLQDRLTEVSRQIAKWNGMEVTW